MKEIDNEALVPFGKVKKTFGHRGALAVSLESEVMMEADPEFLFFVRDGIPVPFEVEELYGSPSQYVVKVFELTSSEDADEMRGAMVLIEPEVYDDALVRYEEMQGDSLQALLHFTVLHPSLGPIGRITQVEDSTQNVVLHVEREGGDTVILPLVDEWIVRHDSAAKELEMDFPEALLTLNEG